MTQDEAVTQDESERRAARDARSRRADGPSEGARRGQDVERRQEPDVEPLGSLGESGMSGREVQPGSGDPAEATRHADEVERLESHSDGSPAPIDPGADEMAVDDATEPPS